MDCLSDRGNDGRRREDRCDISRRGGRAQEHLGAGGRAVVADALRAGSTRDRGAGGQPGSHWRAGYLGHFRGLIGEAGGLARGSRDLRGPGRAGIAARAVRVGQHGERRPASGILALGRPAR